jgi:predicted nucleic acid-binding protein
MGLMLDSSVVIAAERRGDNVTQMLKQIVAATGDQRTALSSVGLTELVHGIYRAQTAEARNRRDSFIRELLNDVEVYPYTKETALLAGKIDGEQQNRGTVIPFGDLLI